MGVSVEMYRARIGTYIGRTQKRQLSKCSPNHFKSFQMPVSVLLTLLLLFMAGIELNPGPVYKCNECTEQLTSVERYFCHQKEKHTSIRCCYTQCFGRFITLAAFQVHVTRHHYPKPSPILPFQCPVSDCSLPSKGRSFKQHLEDHLDQQDQFMCPFGESCKTVHKLKSYFRVHVSRKHSQQDNSRTEEQPSTSQSNLRQDSATVVSQASSAVLQDLSPTFTNVIKDKIVHFYLKLEGLKVLPSKTVQFISENIASILDMAHDCIRPVLKRQLMSAGIEKREAEIIIDATFKADAVHNMHHHMGPEQVSSSHLRKKEMKMRAPYIPSVEIQLQSPNMEGKAKVAQYVSLKETLEVFCADSNVKKEILKSFSRQSIPDVYEDFFDGSAFKKHLEEHNHHKCIQIIMFQDGLEYNPFGPAKGLYKTAGWYYVVGNIPPEYRSKLEMIMLIFLIQEHYLKPSQQELLNLFNKQEEALAALIAEFQQLKSPGIEIDGIAYPVCLVILTGDNLGQHQIGGYVQSFSGSYWCRYCPMSKSEFLEDPHLCKELRSIEHYEECVEKARQKFLTLKRKSILTQNRKRARAVQDLALGKEATIPKAVISKSAFEKLQGVHQLGIKPLPSALNKIPGFHVNLSMAPCLAHDLFEGIINIVLAKILEKLIEKKWFDFPTLNRRIKGFKCKGQDALDSPSIIKSLEGIKGHACETWTLSRLLPLILGTALVKDPEDEYWLLYLKLKNLCEYVCAPKISLSQIYHLKTIIQEYLCGVKQLLPSCLTPKHHYLAHYPELIKIFGPLIRLFTLRFESKHVFFKQVARQCKSFMNITKTLASKYQYKFACDHLDGFLPDNLKTENAEELTEVPPGFPPIPAGAKLQEVKRAVFKGTDYQTGMWMLIEKSQLIDLKVGCISKILIYPGEEVQFQLSIHEASNSGNGYYIINTTASTTKEVKLVDLPDHFPLSSYSIKNKNNQPIECICLKHTALFM